MKSGSSKMTIKKNNLYLILCGIFLTNALLAEIIGVKIFSAEALFGMPPARLKLFGGTVLDFNLTAGVLIWPIVFITTDVINEYFGIKGVRKISFITAGLIAYAFLVIWSVTLLPAAPFWKEIFAAKGIEIDTAFSAVFLQSMGIIIGSLTAFLVGQLLDVYVFTALRKITGNKKIWLRATGSTLVSQLIDSFLVLFIAFYIFGEWTWVQVISVGVINYLYKGAAAIVLTPLLYVAHSVIDNYLGIKKTSRN